MMVTKREKVVLAVVFCLCCLKFLAFQDVISDYVKYEAPSLSYENFHDTHRSVLDTPQMRNEQISKQIRVQQEFRELIQESQAIDDCADARILLVQVNKEFDGFALETRMMALYLQAAVATGRVLVVDPRFTSAYAPKCDNNLSDREIDEFTVVSDGSAESASTDTPKRTGGHWTCLWNPVSNCTLRQNNGGIATDYTLLEPMGVGIEEDRPHTPFFDVEYYGPKRIASNDQFLHRKEWEAHITIVPFWERAYGRFWVRAQISDYFWKHSTVALKTLIDSRLPHALLNSNEPYVAFHIRMTDNVNHLMDDFGRNASVTRSFERFMEIANTIQRDHPTVRHIYVATDNQDASAEAVSGNYPGWTFHLQDDVERSNQEGEFMWFRNSRSGAAGAIGADLETLRRADFLVGSFQSNVYRLAAELNTAYHTSRYLWDENRIHSVDIEWYEDP